MLQTSVRELVYIDNGRPITDSLTVAETFEKRHDKVLRDIRELRLKCSKKFSMSNFGESSYTNSQGRTMPMYILTFDGFAMLAMGYSGEKAMKFKELYINEFNRIRTDLESRNKAQMLLELQDEITLLSHEQKMIQEKIRYEVHNSYPNVPNKARRKYFSKIHQDIKQRYNIKSFRDIPRNKFVDALLFLDNYYSPNLESPMG